MDTSHPQRLQRSSRSDAGWQPFGNDWLNRPIFDRFELIAARYPEKIAVDDGILRLTYRDVQQAARHLARRVAAAVPAGRAIGIYLPNGALFPIAALACFAARRVFVPIDQNYPSERNDQIIQEAMLAAVVVDRREAATCPSLAAVQHLDIADSLNRKDSGEIPSGRVDGPAVVLYTSGSTGRPKGICNDQGAILQRVIDFSQSCELNSRDRFILFSSPGTITGIRDTLATLLNGAGLYIADPYKQGMSGILRILRDHGITICYAVPALLRELLQLPNAKQAFSDLRIARLGGDRILASDIVLCRASLPKSCRILIGYGSTEVPTVFQWFVPRDWTPDGPTVPCGFPSPNISVSLLAESGAPAARGDVAEVVVKSRYVALGIWENGQLRPDSVATDPDDAAVRVIHTADLVRMRADGLAEMVGRKDRQIKIRGFRIDPTDVESVLRRCDDVADIAVIAGKMGGSDMLVAYVVARTGDIAAVQGRLRDAAETLPIHMRPARVHFIGEIPRLPSFKPDLKKLQALKTLQVEKKPRPDQSQIVPENERESKILSICRQLLKTDDLGVSDNFFDAGGNSLMAMNLMLEIEAQLGLEISLDTIFEHSTVRSLYGALDEKSKRAASVILPVKFGHRKKTLYFTHSGFEFSTLSDALTSDISTAFITTNGTKWLRQLAAGDDVLGAVDRISEAYARTIFARHGTEPCYLAGHSFGGIIALETACKLEELGAAPDIVFLFDTYLHGSIRRILFDIRYNGWLTHKLKDVLVGNRHEVVRRARFLLRDAFFRLTRSTIFEQSNTTPLADIGSVFRNLREEASQAYRGPKRPPASRTVLFRATRSFAGHAMRLDPDLGWARQLGENLTVVMTPGSHDTLMSGEYVDYVAGEIDRQIGLGAAPALSPSGK